MIKVLFVFSNLHYQGPVNQLLYLCKYVDRTKIEPIILTTSQQNFENTIHQELYQANVQVVDLKMSKIESIFWARKKIQELIDSLNIDIVHSFGFRSDLISFNLKRVYKITSVRNTLIYNYKMLYGPIAGFILGNINLIVIKKFDFVISCSNSVKRHLETIGVSSQTILNSIDLNLYPNLKVEKDKIYYRKKLNLTLNQLIFLTNSSKNKGKNVEFLINQFISNPNLKDYFLIIVGYAPEKVKKLANNNRILFTGNVTNILDYYMAVDYYISASMHEGMPNAVLEAMAVGKPVILSNIAPHKEIFEISEKKIGTLFQNNNSLELEKAILEIVNDDYNKISYNCSQVIKCNFNAKSMAKEYSLLYKSLLEKSRV